MKDRTEEIKALREFTRTHPNTFGDWLGDVVDELKLYGSMIGEYSEQCQGLLQLLVRFGSVEGATSNGPGSKIEWEVMPRDALLYPSNAYRIAPDYQLPDLSEETPPRWENGTWLVRMSSGNVYQVVERNSPAPFDAPADWCQCKDWHGSDRYYTKGICEHQELPPKPTLQDGWELTGKAVCCDGTQKLAENEMWVSTNNPPKLWGQSHALMRKYNGWRWVARRVEVVKYETKYCVMVAACRGASLSPFRIPPNANGYAVKTLGAGMVSITPCDK